MGKATTVRHLLTDFSAISVEGDCDVEIKGLTADSRCVCEGWCFFAVRGTRVDGHDYMAQAAAAGAACIVCERMPDDRAQGVCYVVVEESTAAMGAMASAFYGHPSRQLQLVGVTGTNGKTTTATLLYDLVRALGYEAGLVSTVVYRFGQREVEATHTTPDAIRLNAMMREMVDCGCRYCFMECSSIGIDQQRTAGLHFAGGIFTNLTHEHLDYHKDFAHYRDAKQKFFTLLPPEAFAVVNIDDPNGRIMVQNSRARVASMSLRTKSDFHCKIVEMQVDSMLLNIDGDEVWVRFSGRFNAANLLAVYAAARMLGHDKSEVLTAMSMLQPVNGRFEFVRAGDGTVAIIDYAHTPDALENVFDAIDQICPKGCGVTVVCGCGGDRDRVKRPVMADICVRRAGLSVFTSDNPRTEDPEQILHEMTDALLAGKRWLKITDRAEAIRTAVMLSQPRDIILIAGKGHETYQIIGTEKHHFDDREQVRHCFEALNR